MQDQISLAGLALRIFAVSGILTTGFGLAYLLLG
jgi:hypothetical protein